MSVTETRELEVGDHVRSVRTGEVGVIEWIREVVDAAGSRMNDMVGFKTPDGRGLISDRPSLERAGKLH